MARKKDVGVSHKKKKKKKAPLAAQRLAKSLAGKQGRVSSEKWQKYPNLIPWPGEKGTHSLGTQCFFYLQGHLFGGGNPPKPQQEVLARDKN